jgi:hypothetical protein
VSDPLLWHRLQFAFTIVYHYLFPQLTIGLALLIVLLKTTGLWLNIALGRQVGASTLGALDGDLAEVIVFVPALSVADRAEVMEYLTAKWDL